MPGFAVSRTYPRRPYAAFSKSGDPLNLREVLDGIRADAELVAHYALRELTEQNLALATDFDRFKPAEAGRRKCVVSDNQRHDNSEGEPVH